MNTFLEQETDTLFGTAWVKQLCKGRAVIFLRPPEAIGVAFISLQAVEPASLMSCRPADLSMSLLGHLGMPYLLQISSAPSALQQSEIVLTSEGVSPSLQFSEAYCLIGK